MRILMVVPQVFYSSRGTPLSAYHRIKDLIDRGHEVEVLTYGLGDPPPDLDIVIHRARGPHFATRLKQGPSYVKIWFDFLLMLSLVGLLATRRYDLLYAHEEGGFICALFGAPFGVPLVYDMHSSLPHQIRDWEFSKSEAVVGLFRWVERFTLRRSVATVAISPAVAEAAKASWPEAEVVVIANRFSLDREATPEEAGRLRAELGITAEQKLVLYAGSFVKLQALDMMVKAIPIVARAVPEARFVLVGGRPEEIDELRSLAAQVGATGPLTLIATRPQSEMPVYMAAADVLTSPRIQGINPPGKLFSYLSSGRPIVATDCPIHTQFLTPGCSILTPPTPEGFAQGLIAALRDRARAESVVRGAEDILTTTYGSAAREAAYERLYAAIDRGRPSRTPPRPRESPSA